jgi:hypothetical protein
VSVPSYRVEKTLFLRRSRIRVDALIVDHSRVTESSSVQRPVGASMSARRIVLQQSTVVLAEKTARAR